MTATKKITKAMELIAASKVIRAQQAARRALPYTRELNRAVSALATHTRNLDHPLTTQVEKPMNGAFNSNVLKVAAQMRTRLEDQGMEVKRYVVGRKGMAYMKFRQIEMVRTWEGFSDAPTFANAHEIADVLIEDFLTPYEEGGVDEIHAVYTRMESMLTQTPRVRRLLPMEVVEGVAELGELDHIPQYEFEPDPETVLDELMPLYVRSRVWFYLLQTAASILASQQRAMKSATDNAQQLIESLTREANQARQAEITQEITEIVGGASALAEASAEH